MRNHEGVFFAFSSPYRNDKEEMNRHQSEHGDGVRDIAFRVEDCRALYEVRNYLTIL
jgi:4-hydroxyphenylpyruvate dioxygenase